VQRDGAWRPSWHSRQVIIFGRLSRVASSTFVIGPWQRSQAIFRSTWTLWLNLRFGGGISTRIGCVSAPGPTWHESQRAAGFATLCGCLRSMSWQSVHWSSPGVSWSAAARLLGALSWQ
jgi:hypothetical protein